jgi:hypothetical protein
MVVARWLHVGGIYLRISFSAPILALLKVLAVTGLTSRFAPFFLSMQMD